jgi:hypothetical protein
LPRGIIHRHVEQSQQCRQRRPEHFVEREQLARNLAVDSLKAVPILDLEIALEETDNRKVAHRLAVRGGAALKHQASLQVVRVSEFVDKAGLAHPGFSNERHDLTVTVTGELPHPMKLFKLGVTADEPRQPAAGDGLEPGPRRAKPQRMSQVPVWIATMPRCGLAI